MWVLVSIKKLPSSLLSTRFLRYHNTEKMVMGVATPHSYMLLVLLKCAVTNICTYLCMKLQIRTSEGVRELRSKTPLTLFAHGTSCTTLWLYSYTYLQCLRSAALLVCVMARFAIGISIALYIVLWIPMMAISCAMGHQVNVCQRLVKVPSWQEDKQEVVCRKCFGQYFRTVSGCLSQRASVQCRAVVSLFSQEIIPYRQKSLTRLFFVL